MFARRLAQRAAGLALAGALAACQGAPDGDAGEATADQAPLAGAAPETPLAGDAGNGDTGDGAPPVPAIETGAAPPALAALPPAPPEPPEPVIDDDPQQLYGLDSAALGELLGQPSLVRREDPARIWQYRSRTCVFDVFLYEESGGPRVSYLEARDDAARRIEARSCLNEILRARLGLPLD